MVFDNVNILIWKTKLQPDPQNILKKGNQRYHLNKDRFLLIKSGNIKKRLWNKEKKKYFHYWSIINK